MGSARRGIPQLHGAANMEVLATVCRWEGAPGGVPVGKATCWAVADSCLAIAWSHAPRPLVHRIHVFPLQDLQAWNPLRLAEAACCSLRRMRSTPSPTGRVQGFFFDPIVYALISTDAHRVVADTVLLSSLAPFHLRPAGPPGGASSAARTATPPAAVVARTIGHWAGSPGQLHTATRSSTWTSMVWDHGVRPLAQRAIHDPHRAWPLLWCCAILRVWKCNPRLPARVAATSDWLPALAKASSQTGEG